MMDALGIEVRRLPVPRIKMEELNLTGHVKFK